MRYITVKLGAFLLLLLFQIPLAGISEAQSGVLVSDHTLNEKPPFYNGRMPLRYRSGGIPLGGIGVLVLWHEFDDYKIEFKQGAMVESATAKDASGHLLAKLRFADLKGQRARFHETHYARDGSVEFECLSTFVPKIPQLAFKTEESEQKGKKRTEYFFMLPTD